MTAEAATVRPEEDSGSFDLDGLVARYVFGASRDTLNDYEVKNLVWLIRDGLNAKTVLANNGLTEIPEKQHLEQQASRGNDATAVMMLANRGLLIRIVNKFLIKPQMFDELMSVGQLALLRAVRGFDPSLGIQFSTYAYPTIKRELRRHGHTEGIIIRLPGEVSDLITVLREIISEYRQKYAADPSPEVLSELADVPLEKINSALNAMSTIPVSLDSKHGDEQVALGNFLASSDPSPEEAAIRVLENEDFSQWLEQVLPYALGIFKEKYQDRNRKLFCHYWGVSGYESLGIEEIASNFGMSRANVQSTISQLLKELSQHTGRRFKDSAGITRLLDFETHTTTL